MNARILIPIALLLLTIPQAIAITAGNMGGPEIICDPNSSSYSNIFYLYGSVGHLTTLTLAPSSCNGFLSAVVSSNTVNFTVIAFGSPTSPTQHFTLGGTGNMTITNMNDKYIAVTVISLSTSNTTFYYPSGHVPMNIAVGTNIIGSSQYLTSQTAYASCTAPCVFINTAKQLVEMRTALTSLITINDPLFVSTGCGQLNNAVGQTSNAVVLLAIGLIVMAAVAVIIVVSKGVGGVSDLGAVELNSTTIVLVLFTVTLVVGSYIIFSTTGVITTLMTC